jgi:GNAT superfamily N-acetyltransferase
MRVDLPPDRPRLTLSLVDGHDVTLSPLRRDDRHLLEDGLEHLSVESRFTRFGQGLSHLSEWELEYLSNVDQVTHVAWGASLDNEGAGVGRYVRLKDTNSAEIAVTVLDEYQRRGVGSLLFRALAAVARADGLDEFLFYAVPGNGAVEPMTRDLKAEISVGSTLIKGSFSISAIPRHELEDEMIAAMNEVRG